MEQTENALGRVQISAQGFKYFSVSAVHCKEV